MRYLHPHGLVCFVVRAFDGVANLFMVLARWEIALLTPRLDNLLYSGNWRTPTVTDRLRKRDFPVNRDADHHLAARVQTLCVIAAMDLGKS